MVEFPHRAEVRGVLRHPTGGVDPEHGDELAGVYSIGDHDSLDLTDVPDGAFSLRERAGGRGQSELRVSVSEGVEITITAPVRS